MITSRRIVVFCIACETRRCYSYYDFYKGVFYFHDISFNPPDARAFRATIGWWSFPSSRIRFHRNRYTPPPSLFARLRISSLPPVLAISSYKAELTLVESDRESDISSFFFLFFFYIYARWEPIVNDRGKYERIEEVSEEFILFHEIADIQSPRSRRGFIDARISRRLIFLPVLNPSIFFRKRDSNVWWVTR